MRRGLLVGAVFCAAATAASAAEARVIQDARYSFDVTWNAAIRMLHVDMGFAITERDRDAGYVMFTYRNAGRTSAGSLEIVRAQVEGVAGTRVIVQLPQEPSYAEHHLVTRLTRKLRDEYGEAPVAPPPPAAPAAPARARDRDRERPSEPGSDERPAPAPERGAPTPAEERPRS